MNVANTEGKPAQESECHAQGSCSRYHVRHRIRVGDVGVRLVGNRTALRRVGNDGWL